MCLLGNGFFHPFIGVHKAHFKKACFCYVGTKSSIPAIEVIWETKIKNNSAKIISLTNHISVWHHTLITRQRLIKLNAGIIWHRSDVSIPATTAMWKQEGKKAKLNVEQLCEQRTPQCQGPLGYPEKKVNRLFNAWGSGADITPSPANSRLVPCQLDLKGSCSEAKGRSCGFFSH